MSISSRTYLTKLLQSGVDSERGGDALDFYKDQISRLNETGGRVYRLAYRKDKKLRVNLPGNPWVLHMEGVRLLHSMHQEKNPYVVVGEVQPGSVDLESSLEHFSANFRDGAVMLLRPPKVMEIKKLNMAVSEQEEPDNKEQERDKKFDWLVNNVINASEIKRYFNNNNKALAWYIIKNDLQDNWIREYFTGPRYGSRLSRTNYPLNQVTAYVLDEVIRTHRNKLDYINTETVEFICTSSYNVIEEATDTIDYCKRYGIYDYIVEHDLYFNEYSMLVFIPHLASIGELSVEDYFTYYGEDTKFYDDEFSKDPEAYFTFLQTHGVYDLFIEKIRELDYAIQDKFILHLIDVGQVDRIKKYLLEVLRLNEAGDRVLLEADSEELADLFCREDEDRVKEILSGEYYYDSYDAVYDFDDNCVDSLDAKGLATVLEVILEHFDGISISIDDEDFEGFVDTVAGDDEEKEDSYSPIEFTLTKEKLDGIVKAKLLATLIKESDELEDIKREMAHCYDRAYGQCMTDEMDTAVWDEIDGLFGKGTWDGDGNIVFDVTKQYLEKVRDYIEDGSGEYVAYEGRYLGIIKNGMNSSLSVSWPDYVSDYRELNKAYNESIRADLEHNL